MNASSVLAALRCSDAEPLSLAVKTSRLVQETGLEPPVMPSGAHGSTSDHNATLSLYSWTEVHLVQAAGLCFSVVIRCVVQTLCRITIIRRKRISYNMAQRGGLWVV